MTPDIIDLHRSNQVSDRNFPSRPAPTTIIKTGDHWASRFSRMKIYVRAWLL